MFSVSAIAVNSKNNIEQFRKSECIPCRTSHVLEREIYDHDPSAKLSVRDDRESQSSCTDLTELISEKDGERPVDAARITEGQRDLYTLSRQERSCARFFGAICRVQIHIPLSPFLQGTLRCTYWLKKTLDRKRAPIFSIRSRWKFLAGLQDATKVNNNWSSTADKWDYIASGLFRRERHREKRTVAILPS